MRKAAPKPVSGLSQTEQSSFVREHPEHIKDENQEKDTRLPGEGRLSGYVWLGLASARAAVKNYGNWSWLKWCCWGRGGNRGEVFYLENHFKAKPEGAGCC